MAHFGSSMQKKLQIAMNKGETKHLLQGRQRHARQAVVPVSAVQTTCRTRILQLTRSHRIMRSV